MYTCAFTGHRRIPDDHASRMCELISVGISHAYDLGCRRFIVGGAIGFDTLAAREVLRFRISHPDVSLLVFVPFIGQESQWSNRQKDAYNYILSSADEVKYISENYDANCMKRRNQAMVEECDLLIAYVDNPRSGSGQTLRMAEFLGKEIINLYHDLERDG